MSFFAKRQFESVYADRTSGGHCHHCHPGGHALAGFVRRQAKSLDCRGAKAICINSVSPRRYWPMTITTCCPIYTISPMELPFPGPPILPIIRVYGNWPWDISDLFITNMFMYGSTRNIFFCPANAAFNKDNVWNFGVAGATNATVASHFRITDYIWFLPGAGRECREAHVRSSRTGRPILLGSPVQQTPPNPSGVPTSLLLTRDSATPYTHFRVGGLPGNVIQRTSFLDGSQPSGGNQLYLDGHVKWTKWQGLTGPNIKIFGGDPVFYVLAKT